jgi:hypothetical protein
MQVNKINSLKKIIYCVALVCMHSLSPINAGQNSYQNSYKWYAIGAGVLGITTLGLLWNSPVFKLKNDQSTILKNIADKKNFFSSVINSSELQSDMPDPKSNDRQAIWWCDVVRRWSLEMNASQISRDEFVKAGLDKDEITDLHNNMESYFKDSASNRDSLTKKCNAAHRKLDGIYNQVQKKVRYYWLLPTFTAIGSIVCALKAYKNK